MTRGDDARAGEQAVAALRRVFDGWRDDQPGVVEGLRDRKKRELRQRISDVATGMFLERGFDQVRVAEIAAAVDVSEKTIFNYFPTKESLVFDREEVQIARMVRALREPTPGQTLVQSVLQMLEDDVTDVFRQWRTEHDAVEGFGGVRAFSDMVEASPTLTAGLYGMQERMLVAVAEVLAERVGVDPEDPEPQVAASIVMGLWRTQFRAMVRHSDDSVDIDVVRAAVIADLRRAAAAAEGGLAAFDLVVGPPSGKEGVLRAAKAAEASSRRVVAAVKDARDAWKQVAAEMKAQKQSWAGMDPHEVHAARRAMRDEVRRLQRDGWQAHMDVQMDAQLRAHDAARRAQAEARRAQADARRAQAELRRAQAANRRRGGR